MLTIGKAALESGLSTDTIRYYERLRLISRPQRSTGGYRLYDERTVDRLRVIGRARSIGLSLDEIGTMLAQCAGGAECTRVRDLLVRKVEEIEARIAAMTAFRDALVDYHARCDRALSRGARRCPLFEDDD